MLFKLTEAGGAPLEEWKCGFFGVASVADLEDPDGDGVVNLVEYAMGLDPTVSDGEGMPQVGLVPSGAEEVGMLMVYRDPAHDDVTVVVEASTDLTDWTTLATSAVGTPFTGPGVYGADPDTAGDRVVEIRDTVVLSAGGVRFFRVRVTH